MKTPKLDQLFLEIKKNKKAIETGKKDVYQFTSEMSKKYFSKIDPLYGERSVDMEDPYTDIIFAIMEILGIELY